jgi:transcriptional regulator of acetoin/glycerol metabolism
MIERGVIMCDGSIIERRHIPLELTNQPQEIIPLQEIEKEHISMALHSFHGNVTLAAKALQIPRTTLRDRIRELGIQYKA